MGNSATSSSADTPPLAHTQPHPLRSHSLPEPATSAATSFHPPSSKRPRRNRSLPQAGIESRHSAHDRVLSPSSSRTDNHGPAAAPAAALRSPSSSRAATSPLHTSARATGRGGIGIDGLVDQLERRYARKQQSRRRAADAAAAAATAKRGQENEAPSPDRHLPTMSGMSPGAKSRDGKRLADEWQLEKAGGHQGAASADAGGGNHLLPLNAHGENTSTMTGQGVDSPSTSGSQKMQPQQQHAYTPRRHSPLAHTDDPSESLLRDHDTSCPSTSPDRNKSPFHHSPEVQAISGSRRGPPSTTTLPAATKRPFKISEAVRRQWDRDREVKAVQSAARPETGSKQRRRDGDEPGIDGAKAPQRCGQSDALLRAQASPVAYSAAAPRPAAILPDTDAAHQSARTLPSDAQAAANAVCETSADTSIEIDVEVDVDMEALLCGGGEEVERLLSLCDAGTQ